jgi:hypothetical protein
MTLIPTRTAPPRYGDGDGASDSLPAAVTALTGVLAFALAVVSASLMITLSTTASTTSVDVTTGDSHSVMQTFVE